MTDLFGEITWLYRRAPDNKARYILGKDGKRPLICIGVNPSTAEPGELDSTLIRVNRFAYRLGCDGWIMLNLYPQRATSPDDLHEVADEWIFKRNMFYATKLTNRTFYKYERPFTIWAAWGTLIEKRPYLIEGLDRMASIFSGENWITIGKRSKGGHPHHPLYLPKSAEVVPFDVHRYLDRLR